MLRGHATLRRAPQMRRAHLATRGRRLLSAAAASEPAAAAEPATWSPMFKTATGVSACAAAGAAATAFAMQQYGEDPTFRAKVRRDWPPSLVQWLEASLPEYMPQAAHAMRIDDEAADEPSDPSEPSDRRGASTRNLGFAPRPPEDLGTSRAGTPSLYSRFGGESATPEPTAVDSPASAVVPGVQWGQKGHPSENALSELGPVAPDDDEPADAVQTDAWAHAAWPEQPTRLVVPVAAARRYEAALVNFSILRSALRGDDCAALQLEHARLADEARRARGGEVAEISLDDAFRDDAYGTTLAEGADELATKPPAAARDVRLQWLRVQEAWAAAEAAALDARRDALDDARLGLAQGGGAEILRNDHRQRQLRAKLASLAAEKRSVKGADHFRRVTDAEREAAAALPVTV